MDSLIDSQIVHKKENLHVKFVKVLTLESTIFVGSMIQELEISCTCTRQMLTALWGEPECVSICIVCKKLSEEF